jgi:cytochrome c-type biogenesis protein CcmE
MRARLVIALIAVAAAAVAWVIALDALRQTL